MSHLEMVVNDFSDGVFARKGGNEFVTGIETLNSHLDNYSGCFPMSTITRPSALGMSNPVVE